LSELCFTGIHFITAIIYKWSIKNVGQNFDCATFIKIALLPLGYMPIMWRRHQDS
jgi:hypothetical protein